MFQVMLTGFRSLPPLFEATPNAVHELTIASNVPVFCFPYILQYFVMCAYRIYVHFDAQYICLYSCYCKFFQYLGTREEANLMKLCLYQVALLFISLPST